MTGTYLRNISPDSLSGLIFGFEGVRDTVVLLNGPTGCKFYHSATSDNQMLRQMAFDPHNYPALWYFGQPRVPCTWLDSRDYVYGSEDKLSDAMQFLKDTVPFRLLVIVNSPGAALIGDELERIAAQAREAMGMEVPVITVESPGYSLDAPSGYSMACRRLIDTFCRGWSAKKVRPSVNLLGISIFHKYWQGDLQEMARLLDLAGIDVNCSLCCECSIDEVRDLPAADLNVVVDPDWGQETAEYLKEIFGTDYVCPEGLPIGFAETERFFTEICERLGCDVTPLIEDSERARARCYLYISRVNSLTGLPKGVRYAICGSPSQCLGYSRFLTGYFGMHADTISSNGQDIDQTEAELVFADGNIIASLKGMGHEFTGIEIAMPSLGYLDVIPKTHLGIRGAQLLCEQVLNGMRY